MIEQNFIYVLRDPRNQQIRYVGKTSMSLAMRLRSHIHKASRTNTKRDCWIRNLMKSGLRPLIERIDIAYDNWKEREIFWIAYFKSRGFDLTNHTPGGDEIDKAAVAAAWTPERRKRQSEIAKMVNARPSKKAQQAALMSQVNKEYVLGKPWTDKQRANRSKNKKFNAWLSNRMREINASRAGKPWTENRRNAQIAAKAKRTSENRESL